MVFIILALLADGNRHVWGGAEPAPRPDPLQKSVDTLKKPDQQQKQG